MNPVLKSFVERLDADTLSMFADKFNRQETYDILHTIETKYRDLDKWLVTAQSSKAFYQMVDMIESAINDEVLKRQNKS